MHAVLQVQSGQLQSLSALEVPELQARATALSREPPGEPPAYLHHADVTLATDNSLSSTGEQNKPTEHTDGGASDQQAVGEGSFTDLADRLVPSLGTAVDVASGTSGDQIAGQQQASVQQERDLDQITSSVLGSAADISEDSETGDDKQGDEDFSIEEKTVSESGASIVPMDPQELAEHEALIDDILQHGAPSQRQRESGGQQSLHLHPVKLEYNISSKEFLMRCAHASPVLVVVRFSCWDKVLGSRLLVVAVCICY